MFYLSAQVYGNPLTANTVMVASGVNGIMVRTPVLIDPTTGNLSGIGTFSPTSITTSSLTLSGNLAFSTAGSKTTYTEGANGVTGTSTLVAGTVTIACTSVTANSRFSITATNANASTAFGRLIVTKNAGVGFTVTSKDNTTPANTVTGDVSSFDYSFVN